MKYVEGLRSFQRESIFCSKIRLSVLEFALQPIFLESYETKSGMESLGSRLEHCLISARKIVKWTVYLLVYNRFSVVSGYR